MKYKKTKDQGRQECPPRRVWVLVGILLMASAVRAAEPQPLAGTKPLTMEGDITSTMLDGIDRFLTKQIEKFAANRESFWHRDFSSAEAYEKSIAPNRARL